MYVSRSSVSVQLSEIKFSGCVNYAIICKGNCLFAVALDGWMDSEHAHE